MCSARVAAAGADDAIVCGSGPTVIGVFRGADGERRAKRAGADLGEGFSAAPVRAGVGDLAPND